MRSAGRAGLLAVVLVSLLTGLALIREGFAFEPDDEAMGVLGPRQEISLEGGGVRTVFSPGLKEVGPSASLRLVFLIASDGTGEGSVSVSFPEIEEAGPVQAGVRSSLPGLTVRVPAGRMLRAASLEIAPYVRGLDLSELSVKLEAHGPCRVLPGTVRLTDGSGDASIDLPAEALDAIETSVRLERERGSNGLDFLVAPPVNWPAETLGAGGWTPYTAKGVNITDQEGALDPSTGGTTPQQEVDISSDGLRAPSVFFAFNADRDVLFFRLRVKAEPLTNDARSTGKGADKNPWNNPTWNLLIDMDADGWKEFTVVLDGGSGGTSIDIDPSGDDLKVYYNNKAVQSVTGEQVKSGKVITPNDLVWYDAAATYSSAVPLNPEADGATYDFGRTRRVYHNAANATWKTGYFVDVQIPAAALAASYFGEDRLIRPNTPVLFGYSTANSNTDPLQKDYASSYWYTAGSGVRFPYSDVLTLATGITQSPVVGRFAVSGIACPNRATMSVWVADELQVEPPSTGSGKVTDSMRDVLFEVFKDTNNNGLPDDIGSSWAPAAPVAPSVNPDSNGDLAPDGVTASFNDWGIIWNTSALSDGAYLVRVTATDDQSHATQKIVGSYVHAPGACRQGNNVSWSSYGDADHLVPADDFDPVLVTAAYMFGGSFDALTGYRIATYDPSGALILEDAAVSDFFGGIESLYPITPSAVPGVYHSVVYPASFQPPATYNPTYSRSTNPLVADDAFRILDPPPPDPPTVDSPIFEGDTTVSGLSTEPVGTTVTVYVNGVSVGTTTVGAGGEWTASGIPALTAGDLVTATNTVGGLESAQSLPVVVALNAADVTPPPIVTSPILAGATTVSGTSPSPDGTVINLFVNGLPVAQAGVAGNAWNVTGLPPLSAGDVVTATATETGKGTSPPSAPVVVAEYAPDVSAAPVVSAPIVSNDTTVSGTSTEADGTRIDVFVNDILVGATTVSGGAWTLSGLDPLVTGDEVTATATAPGKGTSPPSAPVGVAPSAPVVSSPIFAGATSVSGTSAEPVGSTIRVYVDGMSAGTTTVQAGGAWTLSGIPALTAGQIVTATATVNTVESPESAPVKVSQPANASPAPTVTSPILDNAASIPGTSTSPDGTVIDVYVNGGFVGTTTVSAGAWTLAGIGALSPGDAVTATATESGRGTSAPSAPVTVQPQPPMVNTPLTQNNTTVSGTSLYPDGTVVDVLVNGASVGTTTVTGGAWTLSGIPPLARGDLVTAAQTVNGIASPESNPVIVGNPGQTPDPPVIDSPLHDFMTTVSGTSTSPDGATIEVFVSGASAGQTTVTGGAWTLAGVDLTAGDVVTATATEAGRGTSAPSAPITVLPGPPLVYSPLLAGDTAVSGSTDAPAGSAIEVFVDGAPAGTTTVALDGTWTLTLLTPLVDAEVVTAVVTVGALTSPPSAGVVVGASPSDVTASPKVASPILAGATSVSGTSPSPNGTVIDVFVDGVHKGQATVTGGAWTLSGLDPLVAGQEITARATETGKGTSAPSAPVVVAADAGDVTPAPTVAAPIYNGAETVSGTSASPDGTVIDVFADDVFADDVFIGTTTVTGGAWTLAGVEPLAAGQSITATATEPGKGTSAPSAPVVVTPAPPVVDSPIIEGATAVSGTSVEPPGTLITVYVNGGPAAGTTPVSPDGTWTLGGIGPLADGDSVTATATVNAIEGPPSAAVIVSPAVDVTPPPTVDSPILAGATSVSGTSVSPNGTTIDVFVDGIPAGSTTVTGGVWTLSGLPALAGGQAVAATATEAGKGTSELSPDVIVSADLGDQTPPPAVNDPTFSGAIAIDGTSPSPDGTIIDVYVNGVYAGSATVSGGAWSLEGVGPLVPGDELTAAATEPGKGTSAPSPVVTVVPTAPHVNSPIVVGATSVSGTSAEAPGTTITVFVNGSSVGTTTVQAGSTWTLNGIGPLTAGQVVTATATVGGIESPVSAGVTVSAPANTTPAPTVSSPVFHGETSIAGTSTSPNGTRIDITVNGIPVGQTTVTGGRWTLAGVDPLVSGAVITATATETGKGTSPPSAPVTVEPPAPIVSSPILAGATSVSGTSPLPDGAAIDVYVDGALAGSTTVTGGVWTLSGIAPPLADGEEVTATATLNGVTSPVSEPVVVAADASDITPPPTITSPLVAGATGILGRSTSPNGTIIDVFVDGVHVGQTTVTAGVWVLTPVDALVDGQIVTATATETGKGTSEPAAAVVVAKDSADTTLAPVIEAPIYSGATEVHGYSTFPDGTVIDVFADGVFIGETTVDGGTWTLAGLPPLAAGDVITATATAPGYGTSAPSAPVTVVPSPPTVSSPINQGGTSVSGTSVEPPGTTIRVYVDGVSAGTTTVAAGGTWTLSGLPPLQAGDVITAKATVGGIDSPLSAPVVVSPPAGATPAPAVDSPVYDGATAVTGTSTSPAGTAIDVYVNGVLAGAATVSAGAWSVSGIGPLAAGDVITATATETGKGTSPPSPPVIVLPIPPTVDSPIIAGATAVSGTSTYPDGTQVKVYVNGVQVGIATVTGGAWSLTAIGPLTAGQLVTARNVVNATDSTDSLPVTVSAPTQVSPPPAVTDPTFAGSVIVTGTSTSPDGTVIAVFVNGVPAGTTTVTGGAWSLPVAEPLAAGDVITATATEAGRGTSADSPVVFVLPRIPVVTAPIVEGDTSVHGTSEEPPGSIITVFVDGLPVGTTTVNLDGTFTLSGIGPLAEGEEVTALVTVDGFDSPVSNPVMVAGSSSDITPPPAVTEPVYTGATQIFGTSPSPDGTIIDVFVNDLPVGQAVVTGGQWTLNGVGPLAAGDQITATATQPGKGTSPPSPMVEVHPRPPVVNGPIISGAVSVSGVSTEAPGSIVTVFVNGVPVGTTAVQPGGVWTLPGVPTLRQGEVVTATVTVGTMTSDPSAPVVVSAPSQVTPAPVVNGPVYTGATAVSGTSASPNGTVIDVYVNGLLVGQPTVTGGVWTLAGIGPLAAGNVITARATAPGWGTSGPSNTVVVQPNPPVVNSPILQGATSVSGTSTEVPGSMISVFVNGLLVGTAVVQPGGTWALTGMAPLATGDRVTATVTAATLTSGLSNEVTVSGVIQTPPPVVGSPLSTGATAISGTSTSPDGTVIDVYVNSVFVGQTTVTAGLWTLNGVGPLAAGDRVKATATESGLGTSGFSNEVVVRPWPPVVYGPILEGATSVRGFSVEPPGSIITVYVDGVPIGTAAVQANGNFNLRSIGPLLAGQEVTAIVTSGGVRSGPSEPVIVAGTSADVTPAPAVDAPIAAGATTITGTSPSPAGTVIDVYVDGRFVGQTTVAAGGAWTLPGVGPLTAGQVITATATETGKGTSALSPPVIVGDLPGLLRNDQITTLSPMSPPKSMVFRQRFTGGPALDPLGSSMTGVEGEGSRTVLNGSDDDDDLYAKQVTSGWIDPDAGVVLDAARPLVFYELLDSNLNNMFLTKTPAMGLEMAFVAK